MKFLNLAGEVETEVKYMALLMGETGRTVLWYLTTYQRLDRAADGLSRAFGAVFGRKGYAPRLSREMFLLSRMLIPGDPILITRAGFFLQIDDGEMQANGKRWGKIIDNPIGEYFPEPVQVVFHDRSPEELVRFARLVRSIYLDYERAFLGLKIDPILKTLLEKTTRVEELRKWAKAAKEVIRAHWPDLDRRVENTLPGIISRSATPWEIRRELAFVIAKDAATASTKVARLLSDSIPKSIPARGRFERIETYSPSPAPSAIPFFIMPDAAGGDMWVENEPAGYSPADFQAAAAIIDQHPPDKRAAILSELARINPALSRGVMT